MEDLDDIIAGAETLDGFNLDAVEFRAETAEGEPHARTRNREAPRPKAGDATGVGLKNRITTKTTKRNFYDISQIPNAVGLINPLPEECETIHAIMGGDFAAWDLVPATMKLVGLPVQALHIATLGFNRKNLSHLATLLKDGQVKSAVVLCSDYFAKSDADTYAEAKATLQPLGAKLISTRNHAKVQVLDFGKAAYVVESSANLRSCNNLEQLTLTRDRALADFHRTWIRTAAGLSC